MNDDRAWIRDVLAHREQAVPYNFMFSPPARTCLESHYGTADLEGALAMPLRMTGMLSPKPLLAEIYQLARRHGRTVFHHSCGNILPIVGDLVELGLDVLHPIQPEAMDVFRLKREFGSQLTLCGGIRTQDLLPFATPQQVRDEVRRTRDALGQGGGYILEPGITLQADVPPANLLALVEAAREGA